MGVYFAGEAKFCAVCGIEYSLLRDNYQRQDYFAKISHNCNCGTQFIHIHELDLAEEIQKELKQYQD